VAIDKQLYRKALDEYKQWNEAELSERIRNAGKRAPQEAWEIYLGLWNFSQKLGSKFSPYQQRQKIEALERYYERVQKMEAWRKARGRES
jgi:hypothetical protein